MEYEGFVYEWTNIINNMKYIGSHKGSEHDNYVGSGIIFRRAYRKHGKENFAREILYRGSDYKNVETEKLNEVDAANNPLYYNLKNESVGGSFFKEMNGMYNKHLSRESKEKISMTAKLNYTEERKSKHSIDISGNKNPMFGKNFHAYGIVNFAKNNIGKTTEEIYGEEKGKQIRQKISMAHKGKLKPQKLIVCPHCNLIGGASNLTRYHFDNCKNLNLNPTYDERF
jgi:6-phosphogluconolactonase (cycloisomerase 2 family)